MIFKKVKIILAVSSVIFGSISFLVPKSADAVTLQQVCQWVNYKFPRCQNLNSPYTPITMDITGSPNAGGLAIYFSLNPSVSDSDNTDNTALFTNGVESAFFLECPGSACTVSSTLFSFGSGDLRGSLINEETVQYEATFNENSNGVFGFALQVDPSGTNFSSADLLDSLSNLNQFLTENPTEFTVAFQFGNNSTTFTPNYLVQVVPKPVPESDATGSLLGAGAAIALLLKRKRHSIKITHNRTSSEINDTVAISPCKES
jgi:hypothetical protein